MLHMPKTDMNDATPDFGLFKINDEQNDPTALTLAKIRRPDDLKFADGSVPQKEELTAEFMIKAIPESHIEISLYNGPVFDPDIDKACEFSREWLTALKVVFEDQNITPKSNQLFKFSNAGAIFLLYTRIRLWRVLFFHVLSLS